MRTHLSDAEMMEALDAAPTAEVLHHLAACAGCRTERERLRTALAGLGEHACGQADRPDPAWKQQVQEIVAQLRDPERPALRWRWAWVPALASLAILVGVSWDRSGTLPSRPVESDEAFLIAVQDSIQATVPAPLQPVALLARDLDAREVTHAGGDHEGG